MNASQIDEIRLYRKDQVPEIFEIASSQGGIEGVRHRKFFT